MEIKEIKINNISRVVISKVLKSGKELYIAEHKKYNCRTVLNYYVGSTQDEVESWVERLKNTLLGD